MSHDAPSSKRAGKGFLVLVGISLVLIGSLFVWLMARSFLRAKEMRDWPQVQCTILQSEIVERQHDPYSPVEYQHQVTFGYTHDGINHTSTRITLRGANWSSKPGKARASLEEFPPGTTATCYVDPGQPDKAVLKPDSLAPGYSIWFPCLFVAGGLGIILRTLRPARR